MVSRLDLLTKTKAHAVERDNGSSSLQRKVLQESSTECFPYTMNKTEIDGERTRYYTADELVIQDLGLEASVQRNSTLNSLLTQ